MTLYIPNERAAEALSRWAALGGSSSAIRSHHTGPKLILTVADSASPEGQAFTVLAGELGASRAGSCRLSLVATYDVADLLSAELLRVIVSESAVVDPRTVEPKRKCATCDLPLRRAPLVGGPKLQRPATRLDLFQSEGSWFASHRLAVELAGLSGLVRTPVASIGWGAPHYMLTANSSLGYWTGVAWNEPCASCGQRRGQVTAPHLIMNLHRYPRAAWTGDDFMYMEAQWGVFVVSQKAFAVLGDPRWRMSEPDLDVTPVYLDEDAAVVP